MLFPHSTTCSEGVLILIPMLLPHATYCSNCLHEKTEQKRCSTWWANVRAGRNIFSSSHAVACCSLLQKGLFYFQRSFTFKTCQAEDRITRGLDSEGPRMFWKAPGSPNTQRTAYREAQLSLSALCRAVGLKRFEMVWVISGLGAAKVREGFLTTGSNAREPFCNCSRGTSAFIMLCGTLLHFALICFACLVQLVEYAESCWIQVRGFSRSPEQTGCDRGHLSPQPKSFRWRTQGAETEPQPTKPQTFQDVPPGFRHLPSFLARCIAQHDLSSEIIWIVSDWDSHTLVDNYHHMLALHLLLRRHSDLKLWNCEVCTCGRMQKARGKRNTLKKTVGQSEMHLAWNPTLSGTCAHQLCYGQPSAADLTTMPAAPVPIDDGAEICPARLWCCCATASVALRSPNTADTAWVSARRDEGT